MRLTRVGRSGEYDAIVFGARDQAAQPEREARRKKVLAVEAVHGDAPLRVGVARPLDHVVLRLAEVAVLDRYLA